MKTVSVHAMFATPRNWVKKQWTEIKMYVISQVVKIWTMCFRMKDLSIMNVTAGAKDEDVTNTNLWMINNVNEKLIQNEARALIFHLVG